MAQTYLNTISSSYFETAEFSSLYYGWYIDINDLSELSSHDIYEYHGVYCKDFYINDGDNSGWARARVLITERGEGYRASVRGIICNVDSQKFLTDALVAIGLEYSPEFKLADALNNIAINYQGYDPINTTVEFFVNAAGKSEFDQNLLDLVWNWLEAEYGPLDNRFKADQLIRSEGQSTIVNWNNENFTEVIGYYQGEDTFNFISNNEDLADIFECPVVRFFKRDDWYSGAYYITITGYQLEGNTIITTNEDGNNQHYSAHVTHLIYKEYQTLDNGVHFVENGSYERDVDNNIIMYNYPHWGGLQPDGVTGGSVLGTEYYSIGFTGETKPYEVLAPITAPNWGSDGGITVTVFNEPEVEPDPPTYRTGDIPPAFNIYIPPFIGYPQKVKPDEEAPETVPDVSAVEGLYGLFRVFKISVTDIHELGQFLWQEDTLTSILNVFKNNPMDAIISLQQMYFNPLAPNTSQLRLGLVPVKRTGGDDMFLHFINDRYQELDCGGIPIKRYFKDVRDFQTDYTIFLPFIGFKQLSANDLVSAKTDSTYLYIKYQIDTYTGDCVATLSLNRDHLNDKKVLYTFTGNCANTLPLTGADKSRLYNNIANIGMSAVGAIASGGAGLGHFLGTVANTMTSPNVQIEKSGNLSGNAGAMGQKKPYLIISRPQPYDAVQRGTYEGLPANLTVNLRQLKGFVKVRSMHVEDIPYATDEERNMLLNLLTQGVIV